jgi:hypothetical protein
MPQLHIRGGWPRRVASRSAASILLLAVLIHPVATEAQGVVSVQSGLPGSGRVYKSVRSVFDMRWHRLVRQTRDVSCAAASLATLRTYYFRQRTSEEEVLRDLFLLVVSNGTGRSRRWGSRPIQQSW